MSSHEKPIPDLFAVAVERARQANLHARKTPAKRGNKTRNKSTTKCPPDVPTEHQEQAALFHWIRAHTIVYPELDLVFAIPNAGGYTGGYRQNMLRVQAMKAEGLRKGVPDVVWPIARGGFIGLWIELKRRNATPSDTKPQQREWHDRLRAAGHHVVVARGWEEARDAILAYLALPRSAVA